MNARAINHSLGLGAPGIPATRPPSRVALPALQPSIRVVSEANAHEHWRARARRAKDQRGTTRLACQARWGAPPSPPLHVLLTRIAPRELDSDNLAGAFKHVRDGIADWLGINDRDKRVVWEYAQEKGEPKEYAIRLSISIPTGST